MLSWTGPDGPCQARASSIPGGHTADRVRLDRELVRRGLATSCDQAGDLISAGRVTVGGAPAAKPARMVDPGEAVVVAGEPPRFVSRGGAKLDAALDRFAVMVTGLRAIDCGASTGGFTDALLQRGAAEVAAVDVGRALLHERLLRDERVINHERTNVRYLGADELGGPAPIVVADLSFISLATVLTAMVGFTRPDGHLVVLIKPQFEAGRREASQGRGVIRDPAVWRQVLGRIRSAAHEAGAVMMDVMVSPLTGADGNVEFLAHLRPMAVGVDPVVDAGLDAVVAEAGGRGRI